MLSLQRPQAAQTKLENVITAGAYLLRGISDNLARQFINTCSLTLTTWLSTCRSHRGGDPVTQSGSKSRGRLTRGLPGVGLPLDKRPQEAHSRYSRPTETFRQSRAKKALTRKQHVTRFDLKRPGESYFDILPSSQILHLGEPPAKRSRQLMGLSSVGPLREQFLNNLQ